MGCYVSKNLLWFTYFVCLSLVLFRVLSVLDFTSVSALHFQFCVLSFGVYPGLVK